LIRYIFTAGESVGVECVRTLVLFSENFTDFFDVSLNSERELETLLTSIGIEIPNKIALEGNDDFDALYDFSNQRINEFSKEEFDSFYDAWIMSTQRDNSMDEYGQLVFILGQASLWNKKSRKIILREKA